MPRADHKDSLDRKLALIVADGFQPAYIRELVNALAGCGMVVRLIGGDIHDNQSYAEDVQFVNYRKNDSPTRPTLRKIRDLIGYYFRLTGDVKNSTGQAVYKAGIGNPFLDNVLMNSIFKLLGKKVIHTVHNVLPHGQETIKNRLLCWVLYRRIADFLIVHTKAQKQRLLKEFGVPESRITLAHHGTYHVQYKSECDKRRAKGYLKLRPDDFIVLAFGYQRPYKGTHLLVEAMAKLNTAHTRLVIRGSAAKDYAAWLTTLIHEKDLTYCVDCDFGYVPDREMEDLFAASDIIALPYTEGSQSGVLFMAYAHGRPVLASDVGGFRDYVIPGATGEIFQAGDVDALVHALSTAIEKRDAYDARVIRQYAYRNYSWAAFAEEIKQDIYARLHVQI